MRIPPFPLLAGGAVALIAGLWGGLVRLGWELPATGFVPLHGPLMVGGFFATVIALERAVALKAAWTFLAPALSAVGGVALTAGADRFGALALTAGSAVFLAANIVVIRRHPAPFTRIMGLGALCWLVGISAWLGGLDIYQAVGLWGAFIVLTVAGERLELARFLPPSRWRLPTLWPPLLLIAIGSAQALGPVPLAWTATGAGLIALTAWSLGNDVIRKTIRQAGLARYVAVCLLSGYLWLGVAGLLAPALESGPATPYYDAVLHALFVGFVFSMVFGHAPVILPAVLRVVLPYRPVFYGPLALLHGGLLARVTGDLTGLDGLRRIGGLGNAAAVVLFIVVTATLVIRHRRGR